MIRSIAGPALKRCRMDCLIKEIQSSAKRVYEKGVRLEKTIGSSGFLL